MLRLSKGRRKVPLEDLAPSPMNRFGAALSGKHVLSLGERILRVEGFATYRYIAGWCHEWGPDDACAVARDANEKASADPVLPRYPERPLYGVFKCSHLVAFLQLLKAGNTKFPGSTQVMAVPAGPEWEELHDVLAHGIEMEVFPRAALREQKEAFNALMASDNFSSAFALAEDEFSLLHRVAECVRTVVPLPGQTVWDGVRRNLAPLLGNRWSEDDLGRLYSFCVSQDPAKLSYLEHLARFMIDAKEFRVASRFFEQVNRLPVQLQAVRLAACVAQVSSNPETEVQDRFRPARRAPHVSGCPDSLSERGSDGHGQTPRAAPLFPSQVSST